MNESETRPPRRARLTTVSEVCQEYLNRVVAGKIGKGWDGHRLQINQFMSGHGHIDIDDLIPDDLEGWIESHETWKSDWTKLRVASTIKRPFAWAFRKGLIDRHPFGDVNYPPGPRGRPMERSDFLRFIRGADAGFRRVLYFMALTGARPCEVAALEWTAIDAVNGRAILYVHKTARTRKDRAPRVIILPSLAIRLLVWLRRQRPCSRFVFLNRFGEPWTREAFDLRIWRVRRKLNIPSSVKLYGLRHAWATDLALAGVEMATLAALLGHTTISMAAHYVHVAGQTDHLRSELERGLQQRQESAK
jgi:integrase